MTVITRFAPSPTGYLHIGSARTALFNYLFSKHHNGKFLLRIEDTDKERSTEESINTILNGLKWLGLDWDDQYILQSTRVERHKEIALNLVKKGKAYFCFSSKEEIEMQRNKAIENNESFLFKSPWRDINISEYPKDIKPVIRLKVNHDHKIILDDLIQGRVEVHSSTIDDMVLLRADGTPTYMLAVVVDDHDMGITHIIRGDDHLNNAFRQIKIFEACEFPIPSMAHMPLIHSEDGAKLSKRHGAIGVDSYENLGYLPEAIFNYLLKLGWSHGDDDIISKENAIKWFDISNVGKSPSRIDFLKINNINAYYLRNSPNEKLISIIEKKLLLEFIELDYISKDNIYKAIDSIKVRSELVNDLVELSKIFIIGDYYIIKPESREILDKTDIKLIHLIINKLQSFSTFQSIDLNNFFKDISQELGLKLGELMSPIRCLLTGRAASPSIFEIISVIGKNETIRRLNKFKK